jgi:hypothetical protein
MPHPLHFASHALTFHRFLCACSLLISVLVGRLWVHECYLDPYWTSVHCLPNRPFPEKHCCCFQVKCYGDALSTNERDSLSYIQPVRPMVSVADKPADTVLL